MAEGERVASNVALQQSKYCQDSNPRFARFFKHQSRQERFHNAVFSFAVRWISPKGVCVRGEPEIFDRFESELNTKLADGHFDDVVLGLQVVLEALGDAFLDTIDQRMEERNMGLEHLSRVIRLQEQAHQDFGERFLESGHRLNSHRLESHRLDTPRLRSAAETQVAIIDELVQAIGPDLEALDLNPENYSNKVKQAVRSLDLW